MPTISPHAGDQSIVIRAELGDPLLPLSSDGNGAACVPRRALGLRVALAAPGLVVAGRRGAISIFMRCKNAFSCIDAASSVHPISNYGRQLKGKSSSRGA